MYLNSNQAVPPGVSGGQKIKVADDRFHDSKAGNRCSYETPKIEESMFAEKILEEQSKKFKGEKYPSWNVSDAEVCGLGMNHFNSCSHMEKTTNYNTFGSKQLETVKTLTCKTLRKKQPELLQKAYLPWNDN